MPKKKILTERQKRVLGKIGLMPLTSISAIAKRFDIPINAAIRVERDNPTNKTKAKLISRFSKNPETKGLLSTPRLWVMARVQTLAPTHTTKEIVRTLKEEKKKTPHLANVRIPGPDAIATMVRTMGFRTKEEARALQRPRWTRPPNNLTPEQRAELVRVAEPYIQSMQRWARKVMKGDEMADIVRNHITDEATYFRNAKPGMSMDHMRAIWLSYLTKGRRYILLNSYNRWRKSNKLPRVKSRDSEHPTPELEGVPARSEKKTEWVELRFTTPLAPKQKKILDLLREGKTQKQIANILGMGIANVNFTIMRIRSKIRPPTSE